MGFYRVFLRFWSSFPFTKPAFLGVPGLFDPQPCNTDVWEKRFECMGCFELKHLALRAFSRAFKWDHALIRLFLYESKVLHVII